ncbi:hypothetical protein OG946_26870 [Streptomyces sp. NBC_01808]|nr:hypothetical protein [Streptomyces sp. NBC_01808]WSA40681.1 hypothetical protein OG946_26870 [Streptomyces sp. NBC_01808]
MVRIEPGRCSYGLVCHEAGHAVGPLHGEDADPPVSHTHSELAGGMERTA